jgi:hypothetical protein
MSTAYLLGALIGLVLIVLSVMHIATILIEGSIFEEMRGAFRERAGRSLLFRQLRDLFTCRLCMSTQVTIWFVTVPSLFARFWFVPLGKIAAAGLVPCWLDVLGTGLIAFVANMAIARLAIVAYEKLSRKISRLENANAALKAELAAARTRLASLADSENSVAIAATSAYDSFSLKDFSELVGVYMRKCASINCSFRRGDCLRDRASGAATDWAKETGAGDDKEQTLYRALIEGLQLYIYGGYGHKTEEFKQECYQSLMAVLHQS